MNTPTYEYKDGNRCWWKIVVDDISIDENEKYINFSLFKEGTFISQYHIALDEDDEYIDERRLVQHIIEDMNSIFIDWIYFSRPIKIFDINIDKLILLRNTE